MTEEKADLRVGVEILADETPDGALAWVPYPDAPGVELRLAWMSAAAEADIRDAARKAAARRRAEEAEARAKGGEKAALTARAIDRVVDATMAAVGMRPDDYDAAEEARRLADRIKGWRGMTLRKLSALIPVRAEGAADVWDRPLAFDAGLAGALVARATGFRGWLVRKLRDVTIYGSRPPEKAAEALGE